MELLQNIKYAQGKKNQIFENDLFLSLCLSSCEHHINLINISGDNSIYSLKCKCVEDEHCEFITVNEAFRMGWHHPLNSQTSFQLKKLCETIRMTKMLLLKKKKKKNFGKLWMSKISWGYFCKGWFIFRLASCQMEETHSKSASAGDKSKRSTGCYLKAFLSFLSYW